MSTARWIVALSLAFALFAPVAPAETDEADGWAYAYFNEVMSPFCPGRTLSACTSGQADSLRMWVLVQQAAGRSREDVHEELVAKYGDVVLSAPRARGFGMTAYALPALFFIGGGLLVAVYLKRQTRAAPDPAPAAPAPASAPLDPEIERLIDKELAG